MAIPIDKTLVISLDNFNKFTKVTEENLKNYYYNNSIFLVAKIVNDRLVVLHSFNGRKQHKKGVILFNYIWDNTIVQSQVKIYNNETKEEYDDNMDAFLPYVKQQIKLNNLYSIRIS